MIGVTPSSGFVAWAIRKLTRSTAAHAFLATGVGDATIEGDPHGARRNLARNHRAVVWLPKIAAKLSPAQKQVAVEWATAHLGTPYSWIDDAEIGVVSLFGTAPGFMKRRLRSDKTLMCSQLCVAAYRAAGVDLFPGKPDGGVSPGDLLRLERSL